MRNAFVGIGLVLVVLCAGCGSKAPTPVDTATLKAKVASQERSQVLDEQEFRCLHRAVTTYAMGRCLSGAFSRANRRIQARTKVISSLIGNGSGRAAFVRSELLWIRYREASCEAEASAYTGGSAQPLLHAHCEVRRSKSHLKELAELEGVFRQGGR